MNVIALGPLVMDGARFAFVMAVFAFLLITELPGLSRAARDRRRAASRWALPVIAAWVIGARMGFVWQNSDSFAAQPLDIFMLWQGGFVAWSGFVAAAAVIIFASFKYRAAMLPLGIGAGAAVALFFTIGLAMPASTPDLPTGRFNALRGPDIVLEQIGKPVVLNLWATWCPPCRREMPMMLDVADQSDDVTFIFANQAESVTNIGRFLATEQLAADHIVLDPQMELMQALDAKGLPATLIFDDAGTLVYSHTGEISRAVLSQWVRQLSRSAE